MIQTPQDKAALRSLVALKDVPQTGVTDLYFGPKAPHCPLYLLACGDAGLTAP